MEVIYSDVRARRAAKAGQTIEQIVASVTEATLISWLESNATNEAMFVNAIDAAIRTGLEAKRRLLAQAVIAAISDEEKLDESYILADVLEQLDVPHVNVLRRLSDEWDETPALAAGESSFGQSLVWSETSRPIKGALVRTGTCLPEKGTYIARSEKNRQVGISDFGLELVSKLRAEGLEG